MINTRYSAHFLNFTVQTIFAGVSLILFTGHASLAKARTAYISHHSMYSMYSSSEKGNRDNITRIINYYFMHGAALPNKHTQLHVY